MKECSIYKIFSAVIGVTISIISCRFYDNEGGNETANFINTPITKIPKLDDIVDFSACNKTFGTTTTIVTDVFFQEYATTDNDVYCNETFSGLCVASAAMLASAGLLYSASVCRKRPPVSVKPKSLGEVRVDPARYPKYITGMDRPYCLRKDCLGLKQAYTARYAVEYLFFARILALC
jgi:hypothetical protein